LLRWIIALAIALVGVGVLVGGGNIYIQYSIRSHSADVEQGKARLSEQKIDEVQARLDDISSSTKLAIQVLSKEILFSKLLRQLGASTPPNTVLQQFQVDKVEGGLSLQALATNVNAATQLQINLEDPANKIFAKADIENITCSNASEGLKYPCTVQVRALFAKDNPYTFIGTSQGDSQ
jgi:Tfp pilus assembly protein PilN